ncbi:MAG TPA: FAD-dependent oxidoreductase [Dissulfurispiraceae bacterium]|nr:FAD-dependent oxidoreductase [Dissulfurispiraceae bacterium]
MKSDRPGYLIIGGSAAGMAAAQAIKEKDPKGAVTVLSDEPDMPYFRPMIPYVVSGKKKAEAIALSGSGPYTNTDIVIRTGARVDSIDARSKMVSINGQDRLSYTKLLLATGSRPNIPDGIEGLNADGVFALRKLNDARAMAKRAESTAHAVMLGGGLLNLKAAFALLELGIKVTLVVYSPEVLSQLMEPEDAGLIRTALNNAGLAIMTGCSAVSIISGKGGVAGVSLDNGSEMPCQMVCIGKGVKPNIGFLSGSGVSVDKGIVVDKYTACSNPDIFAAGDVAVTFDSVTGGRIMTALWTNAVEMGRCAGYNMSGAKTAYSGTFGIMNATQVADEPFVSMGIVHTKGTDYEVHVTSFRSTYRKVVFSPDGRKLVGMLLIGDIAGAGMYRYLIRENTQITGIKAHIIDQRLHYGHFLKH